MLNNNTARTDACQVRKRIYKGIPDSLRGRVWCLLLGIDRMKLEQVGVYEVSSVHVKICTQGFVSTWDAAYTVKFLQSLKSLISR